MRQPTRHATRRSERQRGFTLIEMIAVLVIIGLILAIGIPQINNAIENGRQTSAKGQTQQMYNAIERFNMNVGRYPTEEEGLIAILKRPTDAEGWTGPYIQQWTKIPNDPWGGAYKYALIEDTDTGLESPQVISLGRDKDMGGRGYAADIVNGQLIEEETE